MPVGGGLSFGAQIAFKLLKNPVDFLILAFICKIFKQNGDKRGDGQIPANGA
jgi:hypothetical protein